MAKFYLSRPLEGFHLVRPLNQKKNKMIYIVRVFYGRYDSCREWEYGNLTDGWMDRRIYSEHQGDLAGRDFQEHQTESLDPQGHRRWQFRGLAGRHLQHQLHSPVCPRDRHRREPSRPVLSRPLLQRRSSPIRSLAATPFRTVR